MKKKRPSESVSTPGMSQLRTGVGSRDSGTRRRASTTMITPSGRLTRKIQRQPANSVSAPPASGPSAAMPPIVAPQTPKAIGRAGPRKVALTSESEVGSTAAPPTPWTTRARISRSPVGATAASRLAPTKTTIPAMKTRLRPSASPSRPNRISSEAKTSA